MLIGPGMLGSASTGNQSAAAISSSSSTMSPPAYSAKNPSMSELGNGHGWLPRYSRFVTCNPTSSSTSRASAPSTVSPGSTNPARALNRPSGKR